MPTLNDRQVKLLKAVVEEYVKTAEPVGSKTLAEKYELGISPATVRNELAVLAEEGFLDQPHTSAGRIPASMGIRYYIQSLMDEEPVPVLEEVAIKQRLWNERHDLAKLFRSAVRALAESSNLASLLTTEEGHIFHTGAVSLLDHPEFYDIEVTRAVLNALDRHDLLAEIFSKVVDQEDVKILIGEEIGLANLSPAGIVFTGFASEKSRGVVGVIGPYRMNYPKIIPTVRYFGELLKELAGVW